MVDASALVPLIAELGEALLDAAARCSLHALDLTLYEVCNAFWKEAVLLRRIGLGDATALCEAVSGLARLGRLRLHGLQELGAATVLERAAETGLTFYDASYLVLSEKLGLPLATGDRRLLRAAAAGGAEPVTPAALAEELRRLA